MNFTKKQTEELLSKYLSQKDGLNDVLQMLLNGMMLSERSHFLEGDSLNKGNGYRLGKVFGFGTQLELRIPRDRQSGFMPTILALFRDQESYLKEVSFQMYSKGLTTRDVSDVMETIYGKHYSKSTVSNISQSFYERMDKWRNRRLKQRYLALYIDGLVVKLRRGSEYANECFYIVLGLKEDYTREVLAIVNLPSESSTGWKQVLQDLKDRGVEHVDLIISDNLTQLEGSIAEVFPESQHQKCIVHLQRNLSTYVRREDRKELAEDMRWIFSPDDIYYERSDVQARLETVADKWKKKYQSLYNKLKNLDWVPYFTYLDYNPKIRRMIYTTNWIESFNKHARRTLKVRGAFPNEESVMALITAVAMEKSEKVYNYPIYNFKFDQKLNRIQ
jgi:transposase-like protein